MQFRMSMADCLWDYIRLRAYVLSATLELTPKGKARAPKLSAIYLDLDTPARGNSSCREGNGIPQLTLGGIVVVTYSKVRT